jgi:DEAD/DEAH box helicase domain-containing protein
MLEICDERCKPFLEAWADKNRPIPEIGFELEDSKGQVCAQAELAWPQKKVALILPDEAENISAFEAGGWKVLSLSDLDDSDGAALKQLLE